MKKLLTPILSLTVIFFFSCGGKEKDYSKMKTLTERIQYDISINNSKDSIERDWWTENIEGSQREKFINTIFDLVTSGKMNAYENYFYDSLSMDQVKAILNPTETIAIANPDNPDDTRDTTITHKIDINLITKVRFLEEWYLDEDNLTFDKKVCGLALIKESYDDSLNFRGYSPLFWIFFDKEYPAKLK